MVSCNIFIFHLSCFLIWPPSLTHGLRVRRHSRRLLDYSHSSITSGEGVSVPELPSAPLSSVGGALTATLMAAAPVRQRSGSGGARAQLPPCYYEGYLEKRGPKEKVRRFRARDPGDPPSPHRRQLPPCCDWNGRGDARRWSCRLFCFCFFKTRGKHRANHLRTDHSARRESRNSGGFQSAAVSLGVCVTGCCGEEKNACLHAESTPTEIASNVQLFLTFLIQKCTSISRTPM